MKAPVRKGLTKAKILEESQALLDLGGVAALTMRALASRLRVAAMALYNHFTDRDAILDALADSVFEQLRQSAGDSSTKIRRGVRWQRRLRSVVMKAQQIAAQHPGVFRVAFTRPNKPASAFALAADTIRVLQEEAGLNHAQSLIVYHTFVILLQGYPFWHEGVQQHGQTGDICLPAGVLPAGVTASRHFEAIIDWLLACVEAMPR